MIRDGEYRIVVKMPPSGEATVFLGLSGELGYMAVKVHYEREDAREMNLLTENAHEFIVQVLREHVCEEKNLMRNGFVMEFMPGGSLHEAIYETVTPRCSRKPYLWMKQASQALMFLHSRRIFHGDIKPKNMLLSTDWSILKIGDFGCAQLLPQIIDNFDIPLRTLIYLSPELQEEEYSKDPADILSGDNYALGITLWELLHKKIPFDNDWKQAIVVFDGGRPPLDPGVMTEHERNLVNLCKLLWHQDPRERHILEEVISVCESELAQRGND